MKDMALKFVLVASVIGLATGASAGVGQIGSAEASVKACSNFATKFAVDATTTQLVLDGVDISEVNIFPSTPEFRKAIADDGGYIMNFRSIITVANKKDTLSAARYNIELSVRDADASCLLISGSQQVETEN